MQLPHIDQAANGDTREDLAAGRHLKTSIGPIWDRFGANGKTAPLA